ncbi:MAG TPA: GNAT family N-acetyltransferase [Thermoplasmataceae archaeon]|nr:GNAT family N-acetyltransferase [Thermoplasmataceae archaeon]
MIRLKEIDLSRSPAPVLLQYLAANLPFTVNILGCIERFRSRTKVIVSSEDERIIGVACIFSSNYNPHIWNDPIVWIVGNVEHLVRGLSQVVSGKFVLISDRPIPLELFQSQVQIREFQEEILCLESKEFDLSTEIPIRRLVSGDALFSLRLSIGSSAAEFDSNIKEREINFIKERQVFGLFIGGTMVSRGAIMTTLPDTASIGAIITDVNHRGKGFGELLAKKLISVASMDSRRVCLFVNRDNVIAKNLYIKLGFNYTVPAYYYTSSAVRP